MSHVETYHSPSNFPGYKCLKCVATFSTRLGFKDHVSRMHPKDKKKDLLLIDGMNVKTRVAIRAEKLKKDMKVWDKTMNEMACLLDNMYTCRICNYQHRHRQHMCCRLTLKS